ncbi:hypothetical protein AURANDRAFT_68955 [Aureococcus anophagefferens]|uniref:Alpha/beta hydrolase n=1 Tax=Aureococcus anophagefferens TaxID=44056 RepID=F0YRA0_AURAN|nr:hypothetical protein AURANDRAFT_68955 [Aureococcus anophagefferens]EGB02360.1 hypothetical protein AURANDRAFT_68955 [Aureococcus anophagefferens]|eukprot:XP_009042942.1 hypothetical protein AURANDRAFT_68955 [Aureococcus anophagefferens]
MAANVAADDGPYRTVKATNRKSGKVTSFRVRRDATMDEISRMYAKHMGLGPAEKPRDVTEPAARDLAAQYEAADLPSSRTAYVKTSATSGPALVLVHGFDSSALESRRLLPELERRGVRGDLN